MHFDHISALPTPSESFLPPDTVLILKGVCESGAASLPIPLFFHCPTLWGLLSATSSSEQTEWCSNTAEGMLTRRCKGSPCWVLVRVRGDEWGPSELLPLCPHRKRGGYVSSVMITRVGCWKQNTQESEGWSPFPRNTHSISETSDLHKISSWFALIPTVCEILWII